ncbi:uncharacterized protein NH340_JMT07108 [Sarcoptes scabiei]|nr:uncharacterized protein NH340_JMT07108 [Sarcoptes scabiei]
MESLIKFYLDDVFTIEQFEAWLTATNKIDLINLSINQDRRDDIVECLANFQNPRQFVEKFKLTLHSSFKWIFELPKNHQPILKNSSFDINDYEAFPALNRDENIETNRIECFKKSSNKCDSIEKGSEHQYTRKCTHNLDLKEERELLKKFRQNLSSKSSSKVDTDSTWHPIKPSYENVQSKELIEKIHKLYCWLLKQNYLGSIMEEIRFCFEVLFLKSFCSSSNNEKQKLSLENSQNIFTNLFNRYENCFYFAYLTFEKIFLDENLLLFFNLNVYNLLMENQSLLDFLPSSSIKERILDLQTQKLFDLSNTDPCESITESFVPYKPETDGKQNFPNNQSFANFRRQRDEFYRLYKRYEENYWYDQLLTDKTLQSVFESGARTILSSSKDVGNSYHLAKLFIDQLLKSCFNRSNEADFSEIKSLRSEENETLKVPKDRLDKLQKRIIKRNQNENSIPDNLYEENFPHVKEKFFRDFIYYLDSHSFNEQLKMLLRQKFDEIILNCDCFALMEQLQNGSFDELKIFLSQHLSLTNLLARFIGFVSFYGLETRKLEQRPNDCCDSIGFEEQQKLLRSQNFSNLLTIPIESYLIESLENYCLLIVLPWALELLGFIDQISISLEPFINITSLLILIHQQYLPNLEFYARKDQCKNLIRIFLQLLLERYFQKKKINIDSHLEFMSNNFESSKNFRKELFDQKLAENFEEKNYLDFQNDLIDFSSISHFMIDFNKIVARIFRKFHNQEIRKIKPTTIKTNLKISPVSSSALSTVFPNHVNRLSRKIEESFLSTLSNLERKCIQFLNDRIIASCIKKIRKSVYPEIKNTLLIQYRIAGSDDEKTTEISELKCCQNNLIEIVREKLQSFSLDHFERMFQILFPLIIDDDFSLEQIDFIREISRKKILDHCNQWITININSRLIKNDFDNLDNKQVHTVSQKNVSKVSVEDFDLTFNRFQNCITKFRKISINLIENNGLDIDLEGNSLVDLVHEIDHFCEVDGFHQTNQKFFNQIILELSLLVIAYKPETVTDEFIQIFIDFGKKFNVIFPKIISSKFLYQMSCSTKNNQAWDVFIKFLIKIIDNNLYLFEQFEEDCLEIVKQDWPLKLLKKFANVIETILNSTKAFENKEEKEILDWLGWFCQQEEEEQ